MCSIQPLSGSASCDDLIGGVKFAYAFPISQLTAVTATANVISAFTMATTGQFKKLTPSKGEALTFVQTGNRTDRNSLTYDRVGSLVFNGLNSSMSNIADGLAACCEIGIIWFLNNGEKIVQGIELDSTAASGFVVDSRRAARIAPSATSGDNDNPANISFEVASSGFKLSPFTSLTEAAINAL